MPQTQIESTPQAMPTDVPVVPLAVEAAVDKKGLMPELLDVRALCSYASYILIVSGRSSRHVDAITEGIRLDLAKRGHRSLGIEGSASGQWMLMDYADLIIHVFHHPLRGHYDLESLWSDAPRIVLDVPDEIRYYSEF